MDVSSSLYKFKILSVDATLLLSENSKIRVLNVIERLNTYDLDKYIITRNNEEVEFANQFINEYNIKPKILKVKSPTDKSNQLLSIITNNNNKKMKIEDKIEAGKYILHLGHRKSNFIDVFEPPKGVVCHKFHKVVWGSQCPYDCSYCFLQLTYRIFPYVQQYLNLEDLFLEMKKTNHRTNTPIVLNSGELSDSLALDRITNISNEVIQESFLYDNIRVLLLSKGDDVDHLIKVPNGKAILSSSLNTHSNFKIFEDGTSAPKDRIKALAKAQNKGYEIRCRIDPIITYYDNWEEEYEKLVKELFNQTNPTVITLGQPRFYPMLLNIIKKRNPAAGEYFENNSILSAGKRKRQDNNYRINIYSKLIDIINENGNSKIALCKEDPKVLSKLGLRLDCCNCI